MLSITEQIARLGEMLIIGEREAYVAELHRIVELMNSRLPDDPFARKIDINIVTQNVVDYSQMSRFSPLLQPVIENAVIGMVSSSGDPDGSPAKFIRLIKEEFIAFHRQEIERLGMELDRLPGKRGKG